MNKKDTLLYSIITILVVILGYNVLQYYTNYIKKNSCTINALQIVTDKEVRGPVMAINQGELQSLIQFCRRPAPPPPKKEEEKTKEKKKDEKDK